MNSPRNSYASLDNLNQKLKVLQNQCKNEGRDVKKTLCHDARLGLQKACDTIEKLTERKKEAIIEKDLDTIKKIDNEILIIENTAINLANLEILFKEKYTDDVVESYIEVDIEKEKITKLEKEIQRMNEIENIKKIEQEKIIKKKEKIKEKEKLRIKREDEYIKELGFHDIKKNTSIKDTITYKTFKNSLKDETNNIYTSADDDSEDEYAKKHLKISPRSNLTNKKSKSNNIEFSNQINSTIEQLSKPFTNSINNEIRHSNTRKGPTEAEIRAAMNKVKEEKYEELNHELDKYYAEIEKIIHNDI